MGGEKDLNDYSREEKVGDDRYIAENRKTRRIA